MALTYSVFVEGACVGQANSVQDAYSLAHQMAPRLGYHGGGIKVKVIDSAGYLRGDTTIMAG